MTMGGLLAFFAGAGLAGAQVERLIAAAPGLLEGAAALTRIRGCLAHAGPAPYAGRRVLDWSRRLALEDVRFSFGDKAVLRGVSLDLRAGTRVGIVGANGAGKTTILNLIMGLNRPEAGRVTADGVAYDDIDVGVLRRSIGLVPQHPVFFKGSVYENIAYGAPGLSREDVEAAAGRIGAERLLRGLPGGLDAPLGEGGLMLSGGERQMIAVLRAMATAPRVLLLDEPTNHLDGPAVAALLVALATPSGGPATVLVSHDPAAMAGLDEVYRLDAGRLERVGAAPG
jgi:ABC-type bacteriocin/lantibiotic exporter with double-glycine peptidase domain